MLLSVLASTASEFPAIFSAAQIGRYTCISNMLSIDKCTRGVGGQLVSSHNNSNTGRLPVIGSRTARPVFAMAGYSTRASKPSKAQTAAMAVEQQLKSMLHVRGIGKKYETMLRGKGIKDAEDLSKRIVRQLEAGGSESLSLTPAVKYLQDLGIKRQDHAQRIITHLTSVYAPELHSQLAPLPNQAVEGLRDVKGPEITFCVEGNISAGKSTFLGYITNKNEELQQLLGVVHEPVEQWQSVPTVEGDRLNLLDKFYADPERYAYTFQNYVFMSRVLQERNSNTMEKSVRLMERSVFSDRMVFVRAVRESGWMGDVELAVYDSWFTPILDTNPSLRPDGFIYLKCAPDTCMKRLKMRGRNEENSIGIDYLQGLHDKHEDWLGAGRIALDQGSRRRQQYARTSSGLIVPDVPRELRNSLYFLDCQGPNAPVDMHRSLHDVPALVLECDSDLLRDLDAQRQVQEQVVQYVKFMRKLKQQQKTALKQQQSSSGNSPLPVLVTHNCQPGGPEGAALTHVESVQSAARPHGATVVPCNSGTLSPAEGDALDILSTTRSSSRAATGSLEVLSTAAQQQRQQIVLAA